ncbi:acyl carrier protein 2, chloroplastic-like [Curcuma longa]|uniref:acyl carrier protein 2, chloroplastic-like n=1 Tax=Curcuma longa TaxID=136217 RepID=UPI003D9F9412
MATLSAASASWKPVASFSNQTKGLTSRVKLASIGTSRLNFTSLRSSHFRIRCAAKPETVNKVLEIVIRQLALSKETSLAPESKFSEIGADSLDTVEIVMCLEEEFNINIDEDNSQTQFKMQPT